MIYPSRRFRLRRPGNRAASGFTLVETMIAVAIVSFSGIAILSMIAFGIEIRELNRERNAALRQAADYMEQVKREWFFALKPVDLSDVLIDDRGTPANTADDIRGRIQVQFYNSAGTLVTTLPTDRSMVTVRCTVTWKPPGRRSKTDQVLTLTTLLAP